MPDGSSFETNSKRNDQPQSPERRKVLKGLAALGVTIATSGLAACSTDSKSPGKNLTVFAPTPAPTEPKVRQPILKTPDVPSRITDGIQAYLDEETKIKEIEKGKPAPQLLVFRRDEPVVLYIGKDMIYIRDFPNAELGNKKDSFPAGTKVPGLFSNFVLEVNGNNVNVWAAYFKENSKKTTPEFFALYHNGGSLVNYENGELALKGETRPIKELFPSNFLNPKTVPLPSKQPLSKGSRI